VRPKFCFGEIQPHSRTFDRVAEVLVSIVINQTPFPAVLGERFGKLLFPVLTRFE
jgi:hypothetical protein